ncbi:MAG TPA: amino acid adenylation domain-containing protein [Thermoanaerobaculia bacterium]
MSGPPATLSELSREEKLALLARMARERARARDAEAADAADDADANNAPRSYPLAFAQQRFWFLDQLEPGSYVDNIFRALRLTGPLDRAALERALEGLVRRHAALRTHFPAEGGEPWQVVEPAFPGGAPVLAVIDLSGLPDAGPRAVALAAEEARRPFDLARGPLFRAKLLRLGPQDHALLLCVHHIVADGWSLGLLLRDFAALYGAFAAGEPSPLLQIRARFGDFARWQRERLHGEALSQELAFWRQRLEGAPSVLELPTDHPRRHMASPRGNVVSFQIPDPAAGGFKALGLAAGATPFMALLALFDVLLFRYTGQGDLVVGVPMANRNRTEFESVVGCFSSTLLVRAGMEPGTSFRELLVRVRREALAVFAHSDLPFEKLVEELQPDRNLSHNPLFQVMFALQTAGGGGLALPGLTLAPLTVDRGLAKLDLTLDMVEAPGAFDGYFEYSTDLFEEATIARLAGHFEVLLAAVLAEPDRGVGELPMLSPEERRQLLVDWNQRYAGVPPTILDLVAAQARRDPEAPAVLFGDGRLAFGELNRRANRLARHLRRLGVGPEMSVGVCVERSLEMPLVLLAVLKSGGCWVPLDPEYPKERLALMIEDTAMPVLLTQEHLADRLPEVTGHAVVCVDRLDLAAEDFSDPDWPIDPESLAYVVYTSGSTGRPKGVAVPHRAMINHVTACAMRYRMGPEDRVLQFTSISFDITSEEIFPTWIRGGAVVPRPPGLFPSFGELAELIARHGITAVDLPTAYWHEWVGEMHRAQTPPPAPLRLVVIGTEQALPERVAEWLELVGDRVRLNNSYASTEATVTAVVYEPGPEDLPRFRAGDRVPVGKTLHNCCAYVLDAGLEPVPVGVPGDVYIGGPNVSRGYANWPDRTAASFVPDPFAAAMGYGAGQRMYRQGDVGRWLPTGDLEYLGRRDDQVKIRGFRVEPAEVGAVLARHPAVRDSIVLVRSDGPMGKRLVGYLTLVSGREATVRELRGFLRESLPEHMVPAALVILDALPLTSNGRVDQRALPEPAADRPEAVGAHTAPRTAAEEILEGIWCEVLGVARVGPDDDFFDLGGHSLLGTQVVSRARERFRVELPLRTLFETPTLAGLARAIEDLRRAGPGGGPPRIERVPRGEALEVSFSQQRLWFLDRLEPGSATYNVPMSLHLRGSLDPGALAAALGEVVRRHEALRTTFVEVDGRPFQRVHPTVPADRRGLPVVDLSGLDADRREAETWLRIAEEARLPFLLERGPLLRMALLRLGGDEHVLLATMHHIVSDGWSLPIFVRELSALYAAIEAGEAPALPELPVQYADFAHWQRRWLQGAVLEAELAHWRERLRGLPPLIELPTDRPRPPVRTRRGAGLRTTLESDLSASLRLAGRRLGATPFMVVLAGFASLLHRYSGQSSFAVGVPVAGRNRVEIEPLVGFFVNTLVMRCDVAGDLEVRALVERLRDTVLDADAHQDVPFEKLVEELSPERSMSYSPLFQVVLAFQNLPRQEFTAEGLQVTPVGVSSGTAKFDLTLAVQTDGERTIFDIGYSTELFDAATVGRFCDSFVQLLGGMLADPGRRISELPLLDAARRHQLLVGWNPPPAVGERGRVALHRRFEEQVERTPDRPAVSAAGAGLTYRELDERANRLARHLQAAGVRPGDLVGLCFERSLDLVVALLATLKAGAGYLPLDPSYPAERLAFALEDSGVAVVLTRGDQAGSPPARPSVRVIDVATKAEAAAIAARSPERPSVPTDAEMPAYVIYTSGSTGRPKGVVIPHGHVTRLFSATAPWFGFGPEDVWTLFHSYAFDFSVWEIWGALLHGGRLVVVPYWESRSPEAFYALLRDERVTVLNQTPSAFRQLLWAEEGILAGAPPDLALRLVIFGGEALDLSSLAPWFQRHGDERPLLVNMYGITETTVHVTYRPVRQADLAAGRGSVLGAPIPDLTLHVVDRGLEPQPIGVAGEIVVGGEGVALGYLGRPELTAERFVPDPYGAPGARLYRSGDLARRLPDGDLEYLGRIDHQVKIRGFRIELGEIEAALSRHPAIAQAVMMVREDTPGNPQLAAYYVPAETPAGATPVTIAELRAALARELPEHMIPSGFASLSALPLTDNGKVDRRALPAPGGGRPDLGREFVPPEGPVQERLAVIWAEVLRLERVGAHDNFFELGGHSLLATQVISRMREAFAVEVPLRAIFDSPTVAGLAETIIQKELERADADLLGRLLSELEA